MEKISVTVITLNEEKNIERCLKSLQWADEIVVLDSFSSDRTVEICRNYTEKVFQEKWQGYGKQKNLCASRTSQRWVLNIDADEVVSPECAKAIQQELKNGPRHPLYQFPRKNFFGHRWVRFGGWYPDKISRLYDKTKISFKESRVHEKLNPDDDSGFIGEPLLHYSYDGLADYMDRLNRYSTLFAEEKSQSGWTAGWAHLYLRPPLTFFNNFIFRQGFREGFLGMFLALSAAFYTYLKYAKTRKI
ncbi:MAG: glycosyltransferase family 2 protein [Nitrospinae bacterium]|nr:glycosyltransferase family 2 protein [Nitrospinota bacterium]